VAAIRYTAKGDGRGLHVLQMGRRCRTDSLYRAWASERATHQLRHTFAHEWLAQGGNETDLMRLAGWKSRAMLQRYGASAADAHARYLAALKPLAEERARLIR
jgi:integrase